MKLQLRSLIHRPGSLSVCGLLHGPQSSAWNCETQKVPACFYTLTSQPPHPHNLTKESWMIYLEYPPHFIYIKKKNNTKKQFPAQIYCTDMFIVGVSLYQLLQSITNASCINISVYTFPACSRKPFRSAACFPASCSPHCLSSYCFVLFMPHI